MRIKLIDIAVYKRREDKKRREEKRREEKGRTSRSVIRKGHHTQCVIHAVVIGFAVITTCCVILRRRSSLAM